jgi:hypothetical protein
MRATQRTISEAFARLQEQLPLSLPVAIRRMSAKQMGEYAGYARSTLRQRATRQRIRWP